MTNNFLQWDPSANNIESDATYSADSQRSGGASSGAIFASPLANKAFFQWSIFVAAFAAMLTAKGYAPNDGSAAPGSALANLQAVLANVATNADLAAYLASAGFAVSLGASGYIKFPASLGGLILQWAAGASESPPAGNTNLDVTTQTINWPLTFPTNCYIALVSTAAITPGAATDCWYQTQGWTTGHVSVMRARSHNDAGRQGDYTSNTQPFAIAIGN